LRRHGDSTDGEISQIGVKSIKVPKGKLGEKLAQYLNEKSVQFVEPDYTARAIGQSMILIFPVSGA